MARRSSSAAGSDSAAATPRWRAELRMECLRLAVETKRRAASDADVLALADEFYTWAVAAEG